MALLFTLALTSSYAHTSWWGDWCDKYIVSYDPEPYHEADEQELIVEYRTEGGRAQWSKRKSYLLRVIGREMRQRGLDTIDYDRWEP